MSRVSDFDRRLGDWLEEGAQTIPDRAVEDALQRAHATPQLGAGLRLPWTGGQLGPAVPRLAPLAVGALGALAVVAAFVLGLLSASQIGNPIPSPTPTPTASSPPARPTNALPRAVAGLEVVDVLPGETSDFFVLVGLAATSDAVWTVAVTSDNATGDPLSRLIRIDAVTGQPQPIELPRVVGMLSPPAADGDLVWSASGGGLHRVDATGVSQPVTLPLDFQPREIHPSPEGLWIARAGGTNLVDRQTGDVLREVAAHPGSRLGRIVGAPAFSTLWECAAGSLLRIDPDTGVLSATIGLSAADGEKCRRTVDVSGVDGLGDGVVPLSANLVIDPATNTVASSFDAGDWSDLIVIDGRLWFRTLVRDGSSGLSLLEMNPASGQPAQRLDFSGAGYSNTTFQSDGMAETAGYLWILADPTPDADDGPQIVRVPLAELQAP